MGEGKAVISIVAVLAVVFGFALFFFADKKVVFVQESSDGFGEEYAV